MATNKAFVSYSETYDLNTTQGALTVLGFHTPTSNSLFKMFDGFYKNFKKVRYTSCDIAIACASQLPIDPLGIGTEPGMVAPQDVLNPMLFKACTGEQFNNLLDVIYSSDEVSYGSVKEYKLKDFESSGDVVASPIDIYYMLMADDSWRKSHPQAGMVINSLKPLVHEIAISRPLGMPNQGTEIGSGIGGFGNQYPATNDQGVVDGTPVRTGTNFINAGTRPLGFQNTTIGNLVTGQSVAVVPKIFVGCLVMPPAILQSLYYRIRITWHIEFSQFRPSVDVLPIGSMNSTDVYWNLYDPAAANVSMASETGSLDANGVDSLTPVNVAAF